MISTTRQVGTFHLDALFLGIEVERIREVVGPQRLTRVPLAEHAVAGLLNLRGEILLALDVRLLLGAVGPTHSPARSMNVIVSAGDGPVSLLVDAIGDVLTVGDDAFEPPPETLRGPARDALRGAYKLEGKLLLVLEIDRLVRAARVSPSTEEAKR
ncbi:MAG: chemotaxis protein CheW [Polyangiaceae bacterium]